MVLQRDQEIKLWGWAAPGEQVKLSFGEKEFKTIADNKGKWQLPLPAQKAGGPFQMTFTASNEIILNDILFGDVWLCSGQSNMELTMQRVQYQYPDVVANANNQYIRQFEVPDRYNFHQQQEDISAGEWLTATPDHILKFSAVAYFFAKKLYNTYKVPIGVINAALGGAPAEAWISEEALKPFPHYWNEVQKYKNNSYIEEIEAADKKAHLDWMTTLNNKDEGVKENWKLGMLHDSGWKKMHVPGYWKSTVLGNVNGSVWFKKELTISNAMQDKPAELLLGRIVDADSAFINGQLVGTTSYKYPPRRYSIPAHLLKEGKNTIVVRVINQSGSGGFVLDKPYELKMGQHSIDLKGSWLYRLGATMPPLSPQTFVRWKPAGLFNAMVAPLNNYLIKGIIWYQGESNTDRAEEYRSLMQILITDWRQHWKEENLPFLFVQLPNFMESKAIPAESQWAALRQAQLETLKIPHTGMAVAIDLGEWNDIHPLNKEEVGYRLALQAKKIAYGQNEIVASGPLFQSLQKEGNKLVITFSHTSGGLITNNGKKLKHFAIAGLDKKFIWAKAKIIGDKVIVWSKNIKEPVKVRYAWADNPEGANLYNRYGLPASPFEATIDKQ